MSHGPARGAARRAGRLAEMVLGARFAVAGGREGWVRASLTALGIALGVLVLLLVATVPTVLAGSTQRELDRQPVLIDEDVESSDRSILTTPVDTAFADRPILGLRVQAEGDDPVLPPGVARLPEPGRMVVSPALEALLASPDGELLRERWPHDVVGTISAPGLASPGELVVYLGTDALTSSSASRVDRFGLAGGDMPETDPVLVVLAGVGIAALLVPVFAFVAAAVRFGGESRDRRLAALRLLGADVATVRRIAAGETLVAALVGVAGGALLYAGAGPIATRMGVDVALADYRPVPVLAGAAVVLVLVGTVVVSVSALRSVVIEPLGVVRQSTRRPRRAWWRLLITAAGVATLVSVTRGPPTEQAAWEIRAVAGTGLLLVGVTLLLPWLVEALVHRLGEGSVPWTLAVRRLQLESGPAVRAVSGVAVSIAAVIALQGVVGTAAASDPQVAAPAAERFQVQVIGGGDTLSAELARTPGVLAAEPAGFANVTAAGSTYGVLTAPCPVLAQLADVRGCANGDAFVLRAPQGDLPLAPGDVVGVEGADGTGRWTMPARTSVVAPRDGAFGNGTQASVLLTPGAAASLPVEASPNAVWVSLDPQVEQSLDRVRNAAEAVMPPSQVLDRSAGSSARAVGSLQQPLGVMSAVLLTLIGVNLLVGVVEQLRHRRRALAVLVAFGTPRSTLARSVLYQVAIPVLVGVVVAVSIGSGLTAGLQTVSGVPVQVDAVSIIVTTATAVSMVLLTTAASLPLLWRLTRERVPRGD